MLIDRLKPEIRSKRRGHLSKGIVLLHDNARPHTAAHTVETLQKLKFEVLVHPPYSPEIGPSDYHLFGPLKKALRGRRFTSDQELKEAVYGWLALRPKTFLFLKAYRSLCNDGNSALKSKRTLLKIDVIISFLLLLKYSLYLLSRNLLNHLQISYYFVLIHIISYFILFRNISYYFILILIISHFHIIWYSFALFRTISYFILFQIISIISYYFVSFRVISDYFVLFRIIIIAFYLVLFRISPYYFVLFRITSHYFIFHIISYMSYYFILLRIISCSIFHIISYLIQCYFV